MKETVWILTSEYNDYDQHGAYFERVWKSKPTKEQLLDYLSWPKDNPYIEKDIQFILEGKRNPVSEYVTYILTEEECN